MESVITAKGQVTIPKAIRDHLRLKPGDCVKFFVHPDGSAVILPKLPATALRAMLRSGGRRAISLEQMETAMRDSATRKVPARRR
ncbi:MAG TPA: AbrB/MazE/SpoVT family DNA-binding domain-containing protein [Terriglobales bacterium]|nr:AbrB/MazE/SpoVT family DNA-binding domain-containing protein [Terriglobales bacterium]